MGRSKSSHPKYPSPVNSNSSSPSRSPSSVVDQDTRLHHIQNVASAGSHSPIRHSTTKPPQRAHTTMDPPTTTPTTATTGNPPRRSLSLFSAGRSKSMRTISSSASGTASTSTTTTATVTNPDRSNSFPTPRSNHPSWSAPATVAIQTLRKTLEAHKDSLVRARAITSIGAAPTPLHVKITQVKVKRRIDIVPDGLEPNKTNTKDVKAEWIEYPFPPLPTTTPSTVDSSVTLHPTHRLAHPHERAVLYIHGGAYFICSPKTHRMITWRVAKYTRARVLALDYRLAPECVYPGQLHDVICGYLYLIDPPADAKNAVKYRPEQITVMGDSAGGGLTLALSLWIRDFGSVKYGLEQPGCLVGMSPWMDLTHSQASYRLNGTYDYLPVRSNDTKYLNATRSHYYVSHDSHLTNPLVSPFFATDLPDKPLPPLLIQAGASERLRDEILLFASEKFVKTPVLELEMYEGMPHVFQMLTSVLPISKHALKRIGAFSLTATRQPAASKETSLGRKMTYVSNIPTFTATPFTPTDVQQTVRESRSILKAACTYAPDGTLVHVDESKLRPNSMFVSGVHAVEHVYVEESQQIGVGGMVQEPEEEEEEFVDASEGLGAGVLGMRVAV
ncbi:hypothetical protein HDV05_007606 [Chytridiales sp. JEL 0842]|nr:hypothetical protein HDV05_007606 [Chytridiales sp. JEL 0842]